MSGYFSRPMYDNCYTEESLNSSIKPGLLVLNTIQEPENNCFSNGPRNNRKLNSSELDVNYTNAIDIESSLKGLDVPLSRCFDKNTLFDKEKRLKQVYDNLPKKQVKQCNTFLDDNYTRLNPQNNINELSYNRYDFPIIDPREYVFNGFADNNTIGNNRHGMSSRIELKNQLDIKNKEMRKMANNFTKVVAFNE